jgi:hypothetical protein
MMTFLGDSVMALKEFNIREAEWRCQRGCVVRVRFKNKQSGLSFRSADFGARNLLFRCRLQADSSLINPASE